MENPIKMDDLGVPLFSETPTWNLKITQLKSKIMFEALLGFHVSFSAAHELEVLDISDFIAPGRSTSMEFCVLFRGNLT